VLAMLEAFVHDPLINWRLVHHPADTTTASSSGAGSGAASAVAPTKASAAAAAATGSVLDAPMLAQVLTEQGHEAAVIQQAAAVIGQAGSRGRGGADGGLVPAGTPSVAMQGSLRAASLAGASARPLSRAGSLGQQQHQGSESAIGDADISVNKTAREILGRISAKLTGTEGGSGIGLEEGVPPGQAAAAAADDDGSLTSSGGGGALANVTPLTVPQQVQRCETPLCPPPARLPGRCVLVV
jgi:hypothetical protein